MNHSMMSYICTEYQSNPKPLMIAQTDRLSDCVRNLIAIDNLRILFRKKLLWMSSHWKYEKNSLT